MLQTQMQHSNKRCERRTAVARVISLLRLKRVPRFDRRRIQLLLWLQLDQLRRESTSFNNL